MKQKRFRKINKNEDSPDRGFKNPNFFTFLLIAIIGLAIYSSIFNNSMHFDDFLWSNNPNIRNFDIDGIFHINRFRVLTFLSFAFNYIISEYRLWSYYLLNIIVHILNSFFVFLIIKNLFDIPRLQGFFKKKEIIIISIAGCLLFLTHPLQTSAVTYIYQRLASLAALFYLSTMFFYIKFRLSENSGINKYTYLYFTAIMFILGLFTKENTFTVPVMIMIFELIFYPRNLLKNPSILIVGLSFFLICGLVFAMFTSPENVFTNLTSDEGRNINSWNYFLTQMKVIPSYFRLLILPFNQNVDYDVKLAGSFFELPVIAGFLLNIFIMIFGIWNIKRNRMVAFGILWFYIAISVTSSFIPIWDLMFEHRVYLGLTGFIFLIIGVLVQIRNTRYFKPAIAFLFLASVIFSFMTYNRNKVWDSEYTLWEDAIAKSPNKARPYNGRGLVHHNFNNFPAALSDFNKAISLNPKFLSAYQNRGITYFDMQKYNKAILDYNVCIKAAPFDKSIYHNRANAYFKLEQYDSAIADYSVCLAQKTNFLQAYYYRGKSYNKINNFDAAIKDFEKILSLKPNYYDVYKDLASSYLGKQDYRKATQLINSAEQNIGEDFEVLVIKGDIEKANGNTATALEFYNKSLKLNSNHPELIEKIEELKSKK
ncbi:MAG: hypothetical protein HW421_836 [Ignavibacteria bacterium]|nr:hypothetical protein [Ignavibacteria bacterium]